MRFLDSLDLAFCHRVSIYHLIAEPARPAYSTNATGNRIRAMRGTGTCMSGNINYVRRLLASLIRASLLSRMHLPDQFGINSRGVFYERNGETAPIDARNWSLIS